VRICDAISAVPAHLPRQALRNYPPAVASITQGCAGTPTYYRFGSIGSYRSLLVRYQPWFVCAPLPYLPLCRSLLVAAARTPCPSAYIACSLPYYSCLYSVFLVLWWVGAAIFAFAYYTTPLRIFFVVPCASFFFGLGSVRYAVERCVWLVSAHPWMYVYLPLLRTVLLPTIYTLAVLVLTVPPTLYGRRIARCGLRRRKRVVAAGCAANFSTGGAGNDLYITLALSIWLLRRNSSRLLFGGLGGSGVVTFGLSDRRRRRGSAAWRLAGE